MRATNPTWINGAEATAPTANTQLCKVIVTSGRNRQNLRRPRRFLPRGERGRQTMASSCEHSGNRRRRLLSRRTESVHCQRLSDVSDEG